MTAICPDDGHMLVQWLRLSLAAKHQVVREQLPQALADLLLPTSQAFASQGPGLPATS